MSKRLVATSALVWAAVVMSTGLVAGQQPAGVAPQPSAKSSKQAGTRYVPPRTSWGDPDLQGNFTNKYEQSTPFERPPEFDGRRVEDVRGAELAAILEKRQQQVAGRPTGVGPDEFRDPLDVFKGSRALARHRSARRQDPSAPHLTRSDGSRLTSSRWTSSMGDRGAPAALATVPLTVRRI